MNNGDELELSGIAGMMATDDPARSRRFALRFALYGVIFETEPQKSAGRIATMLWAQKGPEVTAAIANEIRAELTTPTQAVHTLLPFIRATEVDLREFLQLVAENLEARSRLPPE